MAALAALPALVQTVHAAEEAGYDAIMRLVEESFTCYKDFFAICEQVRHKTLAPDEAAKDVNRLAEKLEYLSVAIEDTVQASSEADKDKYGAIAESDAHFERTQKDDEAVGRYIEELEMENYFGSEELRAACTRFKLAFPRG